MAAKVNRATMSKQNGMKRATMKEVALLAGVSISTVSHVVNNSRYVRPETRQRIEDVIANLNYTPNQLAQTLRGKGSRLIGVVAPNIRESSIYDLVKAAETLMSHHGFHIILCDSEDSLERELGFLDTLVQKGVEGILLCPTDVDPTSYVDAIPDEVPLVQVHRQIDSLARDYVGLDNHAACSTAVAHLRAAGAHRLGFVGYQVDIGHDLETSHTVAERLTGFMDAARFELNEPDPPSLLLPYRYDPEAIVSKARVDAIARWLTERRDVDALLCSHQAVCLETLAGLSAAGLKVSDDVLLVTFDDSEWFPYLEVPVTALRQPIHAMARRAIGLLMERIASRSESKGPAPVDIRFQAELVVRESSRWGKSPSRAPDANAGT